jgi:Fur family transcriptional regulator, ferric uptake regulator
VPTATDGLHELVAHRLRQRDQRYTSGRRDLVEFLAARPDPASISDISRGLGDLPRSSAYRHLVDLQSVGVVRRVAAADEFARFELAEDLTEHHHHLQCTQCGAVIDVTPTPEFEATVAAMVARLAHERGFEPHSHELDVIGRCRDCVS